MSLLKSTFVILLLAFLSSCVGTIEDKNPDSTKNTAAGSKPVSFSGIVKATAISHNKIEVYFFPAPGAPKDFTYLFYTNNSVVPLEVKGEGLNLTPNGMYRYTLSGLNVNTDYSLSVGVRNSLTGSESSENKTLYAKTFSNFTADFAGISRVEPDVGTLGQTQVVVDWVQATSLGTQFFPRSMDPIAYDISYISAVDGNSDDLADPNNPNVITIRNPSTLPASPELSNETSRTIAGLTPGTKYFVRVRAIHKDYVDYSHISGYLSEQNNKILAVTTLGSAGFFDWNINSFAISTPDGEDALSKMDVKWSTASGPFVGYRLYNIKVADPADSLATADATPRLDDSVINSLNVTSTYQVIGAADQFYRISSLESYAYYRVAMVACRTFACGETERITSEDILYKVTPKIAPFSGLLNIRDPDDIANLDEIVVEFDPPVIAGGYINKFELYCFESLTDSAPEILNYNVTSVSAKPNCNGLIRRTDSPATFNDYAGFNEIKIEGNYFSAGQTVSDKTYCFGAVPVVEGAGGFAIRHVAAATIRCKNIKINVPTMESFKGASSSCSANTTGLNVSWQAPTNGIYGNYELFWKEDDGNPFKFSDAVAGAAGYSSIDGIAKATLTETITNLIPGKKYQYGVLSYIPGATKQYSEFNTGVVRCQVPLPEPSFGEWVDIFAVGPKADGRLEKSQTVGEKSYLFETLNNLGQPVEVEVDDYFTNSFSPTTDFTDQFGEMRGSNQFNGVFGKYKADVAQSEMHQYSNQGIVRIAWKDVTFDSGSQTMKNLIDTYELAGLKKDRKFGYKVYRSDDNQETWSELTHSDFAYQTVSNSGLLHPIDYSEKPRSNEASSTFKAVVFTDYSVKFAGKDGLVDRARVYFYKVIPVFSDIELKYDIETTNPQHIIKVTLPPENMALVHRLMANRQTCLEVGKTYSTDVSQHYNCEWSGVGARALSTPWAVGATSYDFGSDLLVDRFELGCDYTRGDYSNLDSKLSVSNNVNFFGLSDSASKFKGCLMSAQSSNPQDDTGGNHPAPASTYSSKYEYRVGDCIGTASLSIFDSATICADPLTARKKTFEVPGFSNNGANVTDCTVASNLAPTYFDLHDNTTAKVTNILAQSEYAAVFYNRYATTGHTYNLPRLRAAGDDGTNTLHLKAKDNLGVSRCQINIPVQDNSAVAGMGEGRIKPRWLPVNSLDNLDYNAGTGVDILTSTLDDVHSNAIFFDPLSNALPNSAYRTSNNLRYTDTTPIARVFSSNDAKLPPLDSLSQDQAHRVCSTYSVSVGIYDENTTTFTSSQAETSKRLMRRTEGIVASAFPKNLNDTQVLNIENGSATTAPVTSGFSFSSGCNTYARDIEDGQRSGQVQSGSLMSALMPEGIDGNSGTPGRPVMITGSSFYDPSSQHKNSQLCTSRYGLQDIVGNMEEYSSEKLFCDFSGETLYLGANGDPANSITFPGNPYNAIYSAWVQSSTDTGRCSTVETGGARAQAFSTSGSMFPIFDMFGNLNTAMVTSENTNDNKSIGYLRNGDGFFLDFGQVNLAPPISKNDTLALFDTTVVNGRAQGGLDPRRGKYFNPIIGLTLECPNTVCNNSNDNKIITTDDLRTKFSLPLVDFTIPDFPVGNSQILSDGMSEISTGIEYQSPDTFEYTYDFYETINPSGSPSATLYSATHGGAKKSSLDNDSTAANWTGWRVSRTEPMYFQNFGGTKFEGSGRYSGWIRGQSKTSQQRLHTTGTRCSVRINEGLD